jgi:hypothetical protein
MVTRRSCKILIGSTATAATYRRGVPQGQFVTVAAAGWRSTSRSDDGQTILKVIVSFGNMSMTGTFGRDAGI